MQSDTWPNEHVAEMPAVPFFSFVFLFFHSGTFHNGILAREYYYPGPVRVQFARFDNAHSPTAVLSTAAGGRFSCGFSAERVLHFSSFPRRRGYLLHQKFSAGLQIIPCWLGDSDPPQPLSFCPAPGITPPSEPFSSYKYRDVIRGKTRSQRENMKRDKKIK